MCRFVKEGGPHVPVAQHEVYLLLVQQIGFLFYSRVSNVRQRDSQCQHQLFVDYESLVYLRNIIIVNDFVEINLPLLPVLSSESEL